MNPSAAPANKTLELWCHSIHWHKYWKIVCLITPFHEWIIEKSETEFTFRSPVSSNNIFDLFSTFQILILPDISPVATNVESKLNFTNTTESEWPEKKYIKGKMLIFVMVQCKF